jgi:hypothetical protein
MLPLRSVKTAYDFMELLDRERGIASGLGNHMAQERWIWPQSLRKQRVFSSDVER